MLLHYSVSLLFQGEPLPDIVWPQHPVAQVTALAWHPTKKLLVTGWENGELRVWAGDPEFISVQSVHQTPITILQWSTLGGRLVSGDAVRITIRELQHPAMKCMELQFYFFFFCVVLGYMSYNKLGSYI
jgi:WD40 repeat protein